MKKFKRFLAVFLCVACLLTTCLTASAADYTDSANDATTKWITGSSKEKFVYSRPMFDDLPIVTAHDIGLTEGGGDFGDFADIYTENGKIYLLDTFTYVEEETEKEKVLGRVTIVTDQYKKIDEFTSVLDPNGLLGEKVATFEKAQGIYVHNGIIYICDPTHNRVLMVNENREVVRVIEKPETEMWPDDLNFNPIKVVIDEMEFMYILCDGSFYGAAMYEPVTYEFKGFFGANVSNNTVFQAVGRLWDLLFSNNTKLSKSAKKLPFSFVDMVLGADGYLFTCTGTTGSTYSTGALRRLNPTGNNILIDKSKDVPAASSAVIFGTRQVITEQGKDIRHQFNSLTIDESNFIYMLDAAYGRIYMYDVECNLITTIGGGIKEGFQQGTFRRAQAISVMGDTIYAVDVTKKAIVSFKKNDYGRLVQKAQTYTMAGDYTEAAPIWKQVLQLDRNSILAYRGLAKAALIEDRHEEAMEYALLGYDRGTYSSAYEYVRKDFLTRNFTWIFVGVVLLVVVLVVLLYFKKKYKVVLIKNKKLKIALGTMFHPADTFYEIKRNNNGSVIIAICILLLWYVGKIIGYTTGFIFNKTDIADANAWYALAQTVGLVLLFVCANWLVCVLFEGKGKFKELFIATCYSITPLVIGAFGYDILASVLTLQEANFISILNYACIIYTAILLVMAIINIQEFTFGKFILTTVVTLLAMVLVVFLVFLVFILLQQGSNFIKTVFLEATYR